MSSQFWRRPSDLAPVQFGNYDTVEFSETHSGKDELLSHEAYSRPRTVHEAVTLLASGNSRVLAGGTDFYPSLGERAFRGSVIDISGIAGLRGVSQESDRFRIGATTTWTDIIRSPLPRCFEALKNAAREIGSVQIQNRGTVAGNICNASPAADGVPPLLALDAEVELTSMKGLRLMPLGSFLVGNRRTQREPDELVTGILVPCASPNANSAFVKLGARRYLVISISMVAALVNLGNDGRVLNASIAVGSCSAVARRLPTLEAELKGSDARDELAKHVRPEHMAPLSPIDDLRATAVYRKDVALQLVRRALAMCVGNL